MYIHKVLTCLPSVQVRQIYEWILSTNYWVDIRTWSGLALRLCLLLEHLTTRCCVSPCGMLSGVPKYSSIRWFKNPFKDYYFDHQSQSLTAAIIPTVIITIIILSNPFSLRYYLLNLKTVTRFLCCLHKVFTICYILLYTFCRQSPIFLS